MAQSAIGSEVLAAIAALRVYTERDFPVQWAMTQNNLGTAYGALPRGDGGANLEQAIGCYEAALRVRTPDHLPAECQGTLDNLGRAFFDRGDFPAALEASERAIGVVELIRLETLREGGRREVLNRSWRVWERAVAADMRCGLPGRALELAERSKTRTLADQIWQREEKPRGVSEQQWREYQDWLAQARALEEMEERSSASMAAGGEERGRGAVAAPAQVLEQIAALRRRARKAEEGFREADTDYLPAAPPVTLRDIAARTRSALVEFCVTSEEGYVFVTGPGEEGISEEQVVRLPGVTREGVRALLIEWRQAVQAAVQAGQAGQAGAEAWREHLERAAARLDAELIAPLRAKLRERYPGLRRLTLIPTGLLTLLPLHAAWREESGARRYLLDDYEIAYAPGCHILKRCLARERENPDPAETLFAVQNLDGSLAYTEWEVAEAAKHFAPERRRILRGKEAVREAVRRQDRCGAEKLYSTHGYFDLAQVSRSRLLLADGALELPEIATMDLRGTWLAVLSACQSGLVDPKHLVDEYQGLPAAFLVAGAQTVAASLWPVSDFSTALLMTRFHENLYRREQPMGKAAALREAQHWVRGREIGEIEAWLEERGEELAAAGAFTRMPLPDRAALDFMKRDLRAAAARHGGKPLANPYWWAAFQCIGAGWPLEAGE